MATATHPPVLTRSQAKEQKLTRYFTEIPCLKRGHIAERQTRSGRCIECIREYQDRYYADGDNKRRKLDTMRRRELHPDRQADWCFYLGKNHKKIKEARDRYEPTPEAKNRARAAAAARYKAMTPEEKREHRLRTGYNLTLAQFDAMLAAQRNRCRICEANLAALPPNYTHIDHDHATGKVRGILCRHCNTGLGQFKDSLHALRKAVAYLDGSLTESALPND